MAGKQPCVAYHSVEKLPVTSLSFATLGRQEILLAGHGSRISVFDILSKQLVLSTHTFPRSCRIHGLRWKQYDENCEKLRVIMFGQKKLQLANIIRTLDGVSLECVSDVQEVSDWILEADFWKEQSMVALVTAHNNIVIWDWVKKSPLTSFECEIQCILYSANLSHSINQRVIVASGTVFNQVLLWKLNGDHDPHTSRVKVNLTLTGHDGVIFGIRFSPDYKRVCSVSDDRTVRVWSLPLGWEEDYNQTVMCADIVLYGHLARVWDAHFLHNGVISSSEDLTCRVWNYSGECIQILEGHKGRNIWSMAVNEDQSLIATGGGDCAILLTQLHKSTRPKSVLFKLRLGGQEECKDFVRGVCLLTTDSVLCLTDQGKLYSVIVDSTRKMYTWTCLSEDTRFASYSVVSVSPCRQVVALGNLEGKLKVASLNITTEGVSLGPEVVQTAHRGKIFSLVFLESDKPGISMVTTGPEGQGVWWRVIPGTIYRVVPLVNGHTSLVLPPCKHRWVTAAAAVPLQKSEECVLVCGDRKGSLHSYLVQEGSKGIEEPLLPVSSLLGLHGQHGVSSLRHCNGRVLSTGREGNIRHYSVGQDGVLVEIAKFKVFKGFDWVERMYFLGGQEYVVGFHSTDFIIYNLTKGQTVASLQCGGGHRSWDVCMNTEGTGKHGFACVKGSEIHFHHIELSLEPRQVVLEEGFHGRETNCMMMYHSSKDLSYIVTGSEDCSVRLFCYNSNTNSLSPVASYEGHISSVRALASSVSCVEMGKTLLFSGGGRARLIAWEVQGVANPRPCPPELVSLAKTSFSLLSDHKRRKLQKNPTLPQPPADSRIMGLTAFPLSLLTKSHSTDNLHCVIAACSDAIVRIYIFDAEARIFHQIEHTLQHPNCLFCIQHIIISNSNGEDKLSGCTGFHSNFPSCATTSCAYILVGGASGEIHVWRLNTLLEDWMQGHLNGLKSEAITKEEATARNLKDVFENEIPNQPSGVNRDLNSDVRCVKLDVDCKNGSSVVSVEADEHEISVCSGHLDGGGVSRSGKADEQVVFGDVDSQVSHLDNKVMDLENKVTDIHLDTNKTVSHLDSSETVGHFDGKLKTSFVDADEKATILETNVKDNEYPSVEKSSHIDPTVMAGESNPTVCRQERMSPDNEGSEIQPIAVFPSHQSGVNAVDGCCFDIGESVYLVATGGDDTGFTVMLCKFSPLMVSLVAKETRPSAHYAAITGVVWKGVSHILTTSVDQRISLWMVTVVNKDANDLTRIMISHVRTTMTDVADVSCLRAFHTSHNQKLQIHEKHLLSGEEQPVEPTVVGVTGVGIQCLRI